MTAERSGVATKARGWFRRVAAGCLGAALAAFSSPAAPAVVDQQQLAADPLAPGFRVGGPTEQALAQTVAAGLTGDLTSVRLPVACTSGSLVLQVQSVAGGVPSGVVLASEAIAAAALPPAPPDVEFRTIPLGTPLFFAAGERFALVLRSTGSCEVAAGPVGDPYPRGGAFFRDRATPAGAWLGLDSRSDLPFQTIVGAGPGAPALADDGLQGFVSVRCFIASLLP